MDLDRMIVEHCSPVLAKIKTANLISVKYTCYNTLIKQFNIINDKLITKGITMKILRVNPTSVLIYVFRSNFLELDLSNSISKEILFNCGYQLINTNECIDYLINRLKDDEFPHEIGLFLGYPPNDVLGFICNKGKNCCYTGYWKVYSNLNDALETFKKFDICKSIFKQRFKNKYNLAQLAVA